MVVTGVLRVTGVTSVAVLQAKARKASIMVE
jgi:hypothetical protein